MIHVRVHAAFVTRMLYSALDTASDKKYVSTRDITKCRSELSFMYIESRLYWYSTEVVTTWLELVACKKIIFRWFMSHEGCFMRFSTERRLKTEVSLWEQK